MIIIALSTLLIGIVIVVVLTYNGYISDQDKDGIPDKVEEKISELKKKIKRKK